MNKICTSIEQSKKLAEILPIEGADMHWQYIEEDDRQLQWFYFPKDFSINQHNTIPAWSLTALLKLMPKCIISTPNPLSTNYCCRNVEFDMEFYADNPVDAAFETLSWLLENKKL